MRCWPVREPVGQSVEPIRRDAHVRVVEGLLDVRVTRQIAAVQRVPLLRLLRFGRRLLEIAEEVVRGGLLFFLDDSLEYIDQIENSLKEPENPILNPDLLKKRKKI